jgi:hypothetical protein
MITHSRKACALKYQPNNALQATRKAARLSADVRRQDAGAMP